MQDTSRTRPGIAGLWLGAGASILAVVLILHGPPDPDLAVQMEHIVEGHGRWAIVHWTAAVALFLISGAAFINLATSITVRRSPVLTSAWMVMSLGALITVSTAVSEAAVVSAAANRGDLQAFETWWAFSSGMANGFFALALATALIAYSESRANDTKLPVWASVAGILAGVLSAVGWSLGEHFGIGIGGPIWLISSLFMCIWLTWYGLASHTVHHEDVLMQRA